MYSVIVTALYCTILYCSKPYYIVLCQGCSLGFERPRLETFFERLGLVSRQSLQSLGLVSAPYVSFT